MGECTGVHSERGIADVAAVEFANTESMLITTELAFAETKAGYQKLTVKANQGFVK